jgi:hypothetical protein
VVDWIRDRALTLVLMAMFGLFLVGQVLTGLQEYNSTQRAHGDAAVTVSAYLTTGHLWEATFENRESDFLQMAAFVPADDRPPAESGSGIHRNLHRCMRHTMTPAADALNAVNTQS